MVDVQGGDLSASKVFPKFSILAELRLAKKCPKVDIHLPYAGYDNQSCRILMVIFN